MSSSPQVTKTKNNLRAEHSDSPCSVHEVQHPLIHLHLARLRDEATAKPVHYYDKLPQEHPVDVAILLDPMLATGGSAMAARMTLRDWGVEQGKVISLIASREGVDTVSTQFPEAQIYVCHIDPELNDQNFIVPGLGDAGDRVFNTLEHD